MTVENFIILLAILSTITSLSTKGIKKFLNTMETPYASNIVVLVVAVIVGGIGTIIFYMWNGIAWTSINVIIIFIMMFANWLGAMLGYDKVMQAIAQIKKIKSK